MKTNWKHKLAEYAAPVFHGMTLKTWRKLRASENMEIDRPYRRRYLPTLQKCLMNSLLAELEKKKFEKKIRNTEVQPPLFILGHWRSGTTWLHNMLSLDENYACPNVYQTMNPLTFLTTEETMITRIFGSLVPENRFFDQIAFNLGVPNEEEFAAWHSNGLTSCMSWSFPRAAEKFDRFLSFKNADTAEITRWQAALIYFLKKVTFKYKRPLLLKSPQNTCRIKLLLDMFPRARFIHIYRNPYRIFQSTCKLNAFALNMFTFQRYDLSFFRERVIRQYREMYDIFFAEKALIPAGHFHELSFEDLEKNPCREIEKIYAGLSLYGFAAFKPQLENYLKSLSPYKKNTYLQLENDIKRRLRKSWAQNFNLWGYGE